MKMKPEHFNHLLEAIQPLTGKIQSHREFLIKENKAKDIETRLRWDLFWAARLNDYVRDTLYPYLNDDHINTALKAVMKKLEVDHV